MWCSQLTYILIWYQIVLSIIHVGNINYINSNLACLKFWANYSISKWWMILLPFKVIKMYWWYLLISFSWKLFPFSMFSQKYFKELINSNNVIHKSYGSWEKINNRRLSTSIIAFFSLWKLTIWMDFSHCFSIYM